MNINSTESMLYQKNNIARTSPSELIASNPLPEKKYTISPETEQAINQAKQSSGVEPQLKSPEKMIQDQQEKRDRNQSIQLNNSPMGNLGNNVNLYA